MKTEDKEKQASADDEANAPRKPEQPEPKSKKTHGPVVVFNGGQLIRLPANPGERQGIIQVESVIGIKTVEFETINAGKRYTILDDVFRPVGFTYSRGDKRIKGTQLLFNTGGVSIARANKQDILMAMRRAVVMLAKTRENEAVCDQEIRDANLEKWEGIDPEARCRECGGNGERAKGSAEDEEPGVFVREVCPKCKGKGIDEEARKIHRKLQAEKKKIIKIERRVKKQRKGQTKHKTILEERREAIKAEMKEAEAASEEKSGEPGRSPNIT